MSENRRAIRTVLKQLLTGIVSLFVGAGVIILFISLLDNLHLSWPDGEKYQFFIGIIGSPLGLLFLVVAITQKQFKDALSPTQVFRESLKYARIGGICTLLFDIFVWVMMGLLYRQSGVLPLVFLEIMLICLLCLLLGLVVGSIQALRLQIENFNPANHTQLISEEADLQAARIGMLPYRHQVGMIWGVTFFTLLALLLVLAAIWGASETRNTVSRVKIDDPCLIGLNIFVVGLSVFMINRGLKLLFNPHIRYIEGQITAKDRHPMPRGRDRYSLVCEGQRFTTDFRTWNSLRINHSYRLWISFIGKRVYAYQLLS